jgi:glycosyltransferase involved in cell wall biosynthesis
MKIAYVIINANRHEGTARAIWEVAERVAENHEVHLWARTAEMRQGSRVIWKRIPGPSRPDVADFESFRFFANRQLLNHGYDIIHSAGPNTDVANVYTIQTVHSFKMANLNPLRKNATASTLRRICWRLYDSRVLAAEGSAYTTRGPLGQRFFLPVSEGTRSELLCSYPGVTTANSDNIRVVPNAADLEVFCPKNRERFRSSVRQQLGLKDDDFVIAFSGGDWRRKGLDFIFQALKLIPDEKVKLIVIGQDRSDHDLRYYPKEMGLSSRVSFLGFCRDVEIYYSASDLFVFPTSYEAFSLATIEAAASGLPVLMCDVSGAHELVGDGSCGEIIERNPGAIAEAIVRYQKTPSLLASASSAARQRVERFFNWDVVTAMTLETYESAVNQRLTTNVF